MANNVILPYSYFPFFDKSGPIWNAKIYIGQPDTDPTIPANQVTVTAKQESGETVGIPQPIRTSHGGVVIYNGAPAQIVVDNSYSIAVYDKNDKSIYYNPNFTTADVNTVNLGGLTNYQAANVDDMIAGITLGGEIITHEVGQVWSTQNMTWIVESVSNPVSISDFSTSSDVHASDFGAEPSSDSFGSLLAAASIAKGHTDVVVINDDLFSLSDDQIAFSDITFCGSGSISGIYRKNVFTKISSDTRPSFWQLPSNQAIKMNKGRPRVVLVGDSVSTYAANSRNRNYMLTGALEREIKRQFGDCEFFNRAWGGRSYTSFDGNVTNTSLDWYTTTKPWLDYVEELSPDVVFVSFGMNDSSDVNYDSIKSVFDKMEAWEKVPAIVLCTNLTPSLSGNSSFEFADRENQEGRDYAAGITRTFALYRGYGLLDFNRQHNFIRDGLDVFGGRIGNNEFIDPVSNLLTGSRECYNYRCQISIDESKMIDSSSAYVDVSFDNEFKSRVRIRNSGGTLRFSFFTGTSTSIVDNYSVVDTAEVVGSSVRNLCVEISGNTFTAYRNDNNLGETTPPIISVNIMRAGGLITPQIRSDADSKLDSSRFDYGDGFVGYPAASDSKLWADAQEPGSIRKWDGSGWNHPSNHMFAYVYDPILSKVKFKYGGGFYSVDLSSMIYTNATIVSDGTGPAGGDKFLSLSLSESVNNTAVFIAKESSICTNMDIYYVADNSLGDTVSFQVISSKFESDGVRFTENLLVGPILLDNTTTDVRIARVPVSEIAISSGDEVSVFRNTAAPSDNYGPLKLLGIRFS
jgi:hypothetical protein